VGEELWWQWDVPALVFRAGGHGKGERPGVRNQGEFLLVEEGGHAAGIRMQAQWCDGAGVVALECLGARRQGERLQACGGQREHAPAGGIVRSQVSG
jgi:hypothetical protein